MPHGAHPDLYEQLLALAEGITPRVQAIPPDAAHLDISGALRYWGRSPEQLAALLRLRTMALHGVQTTCAIAPNRMLAAMAAAATGPGATTVLEAREVQAWLRPRPAAALHQVGPATANKLRTYALHTIGDIADAPVPTLVRLFGAATGRSLRAHAQGQDLRTVQPQPASKSRSAERTFDHDILDPAEHRRTLLDLTEALGARLRDDQQATGNLTISVRYADRTGSTRSRTLPEPTAHTRPLTTTAYETGVGTGSLAVA
ncbi:hypothetical protein OG765_28715 [Streptomyces sp. NBC_00555]|uniref:DNA polymerase Y family protein n=1 Tax=Streptomyces sp. NBC_00555 TaxID=2903662 RepID=UPI002251847A|nr:hypothetical protein [Streptomyces sp. NBC_00555]MCX5014936.1 hypothetical protein [Streptomyces sp. NBC_00555]